MSLFDDWQEIDRRGQQYLPRDDGYVPWGTNIVEGAKDLAGRAVNQLQEWAKDDPDTWTDDALRLMGGGVKNVGNTMADWERRSEEGELGIRSAAGTALRFMNWSSEKGADIGGAAVGALGGHEDIGRFFGSFLPEAIGTKGLTKAAQIGKTTKQLSKLRKLGITDWQLDDITKGYHAMAFGDQPTSLLGDIKTAATTSKKARKSLGKLESAVDEQLAIGKEFAKRQDNIAKWTVEMEGAAERLASGQSKAGGKKVWRADRKIVKTRRRNIADAKVRDLIETRKSFMDDVTPLKKGWERHHIAGLKWAEPLFEGLGPEDARELSKLARKHGVEFGDTFKNRHDMFKPEHNRIHVILNQYSMNKKAPYLQNLEGASMAVRKKALVEFITDVRRQQIKILDLELGLEDVYGVRKTELTDPMKLTMIKPSLTPSDLGIKKSQLKSKIKPKPKSDKRSELKSIQEDIFKGL